LLRYSGRAKTGVVDCSKPLSNIRIAMPSRRSARTLNALFVLQASLAVAILAGDVVRRLNVVVVDNWADMKTQCECRIRSFSRAII
jgi:hypothetical protein